MIESNISNIAPHTNSTQSMLALASYSVIPIRGASPVAKSPRYCYMRTVSVNPPLRCCHLVICEDFAIRSTPRATEVDRGCIRGPFLPSDRQVSLLTSQRLWDYPGRPSAGGAVVALNFRAVDQSERFSSFKAIGPCSSATGWRY